MRPKHRPKNISELIATLKDEGLTTIQKNRLVGTVYSGIVEVKDVKEVETYGDKAAKPVIRIMVEVGARNPNWFWLAFETTDVERGARLRKGDMINISGKLVRFSVHGSGYRNVTDDEWAVFEQVVILER